MAAPGSEISNQFLKELVSIKNVLDIRDIQLAKIEQLR